MASPLPIRAPVRRRPLDMAAIALAPLGIGVIVLAQTLSGVPVRALFRLDAALIVFGGTLGAVLVSHSVAEVIAALRATGRTFFAIQEDMNALAATIMGLAVRAHRRGLITIEPEVERIAEPFLKEGLTLAIDEPSTEVLRDVLAVESAARSATDEAPARILEAAAGYAPTLGILGAVLGLIHVMRTLTAPNALGSGIAVAFVATVYGVGAANLVFLPLACRLRERAALAARRRDLMTQGICAIQQRVHPRVLGQKLRAFGVKASAVDERSVRLARPERGKRLPA